MFLIEEELKKLPGKPGVYIMHGEKDEIIYVGKAVSLKNRVRGTRADRYASRRPASRTFYVVRSSPNRI